MHYDNPQGLSNLVDNSGLKLYFTNQLRQYDLGLLILGTEGNPLSIQIPPNANAFKISTTCYPECTTRFFPEDGIYAVSGLLHTHLAGWWNL